MSAVAAAFTRCCCNSTQLPDGLSTIAQFAWTQMESNGLRDTARIPVPEILYFTNTPKSSEDVLQSIRSYALQIVQSGTLAATQFTQYCERKLKSSRIQCIGKAHSVTISRFTSSERTVRSKLYATVSKCILKPEIGRNLQHRK